MSLFAIYPRVWYTAWFLHAHFTYLIPKSVLISKLSSITKISFVCSKNVHLRSTIHRHVHVFSSQIPIENRIFSQFHLNIMHPLPPFDCYTLLLACFDRFICWQSVVPIVDTSNQTHFKTCLHYWIPNSGVPSAITVDRDPQVQTKLPADFSILLQFKHIQKTVFQP